MFSLLRRGFVMGVCKSSRDTKPVGTSCRHWLASWLPQRVQWKWWISAALCKFPCAPGVLLATDISLPKGKGPFPAILLRTPYTTALGELSDNANQRGREFGRKFAAGDMPSFSRTAGARAARRATGSHIRERDDGVDLQEWSLAQPVQRQDRHVRWLLLRVHAIGSRT